MAYETGDAVSIQGEDSSVYILDEKGQGIYGTDNLSLNNNIKYRLRVTAYNGEIYMSDFVAVKTNPPVDSISWRIENGGVQLYINTHDPQNNARYYQWVYDETWEFHATYQSVLKYKVTYNSATGNQYSVVYRDSTTFSADPTIFACWQFNAPTSLFLGSTAKLSQDIVEQPLAFIPKASIKLSVLYSIHLTQYTWTAAGYAFLENMKKNTELTGTVFDAQPSELKGNIHSVTNASEPVIGYFNICPVQEKRIFIKNSDVPGWNYNPGCSEQTLNNNSDEISEKGLDLLPTTVATISRFGDIGSFRAAPPACVDCTTIGTNKKPVYWP